MAGSYIKIAETTISSSTASVTLTGMSSTYNVYMLVINNCAPVQDNYYLRCRFTEGGSAVSTSNYDYAMKYYQDGGTPLNLSGSNGDAVNITNHTNGTGTSETTNLRAYIFNAPESGRYTTLQTDSTNVDSSNAFYSTVGGFNYTVTSAVDGLHFYYSTGNIATGTFKLYGIQK
jgi:hypothetical protein